MYRHVTLQLLALALLLVATLGKRGSNLEQGAISKQRPFRRQGWGLSNQEEASTCKDKLPVKEVKNVVKDKKSTNAPTNKDTTTRKSKIYDEIMDGFE